MNINAARFWGGGKAPMSAGHQLLFATLVVLAVMMIYFAHGANIFDVYFADETIYLAAGLREQGIDFSSYERVGLYALYYRALSNFFPDTVDLYLYGGLITIVACAAAVFAASAALSRSPFLAMLAAGLFIGSGALKVGPRISHAAIVVLALGLIAATLVRPAFARAAIIMLAAFLAAFIRPEYVLGFYIFAALTAALLVREVARGLVSGSARTAFRRSLLPGWLAILAVLILIQAWSFPILGSGQRAFVAFSQHFAVRYVETNKLTINPWWNHAMIVRPMFPNATSVYEAAKVAPGTFANFVKDNTLDLFSRLGKLVAKAFRTNPPGGKVARYFGLMLIGAGIALAATGSMRLRKKRAGERRGEHDQHLMLVGAAALLAIPPTLSAMLIYPRDHYLIIILFLLIGCVCAGLRRTVAPPSAAALGCVAAGMLLATQVLPRDPQITLRDIRQVRQIPGIRSLVDADLGWCVYYRPRCHPIYPWPSGTTADGLEEWIKKDPNAAIMVSPGLRAIKAMETDPYLRKLDADPAALGYAAIQLPSGRVLMLKE